MQEKIVATATDLGKCYRIFQRKRDRIKQAVSRHNRKYYSEFWAVRHVNFELLRGESLAVIGRNGSGKSTLLQLLCGILSPSEGSMAVRGRIAALLELGSGFNPDFTGLENVYLNASLLGLSRKEIDDRVDSILAFADIGDFVEQPVRCYSSGMMVRLAFAVVAHVQADLLIIDEALAVGDIFFIQKCMRFINQFREENALILVTHDTQAVLASCSHGILLEDGQQTTAKLSQRQVVDIYTERYYNAQSPDAQRAVSAHPAAQAPIEVWQGERQNNIDSQSDYEQTVNHAISKLFEQEKSVHRSLQRFDDMRGFSSGEAVISAVWIANTNPSKPSVIAEGEVVTIGVRVKAHSNIENPIIGFAIKNAKGIAVLGDNTYTERLTVQPNGIRAGDEVEGRFSFTMPRLMAGHYTIHAAIARGTQEEHQQLHFIHDACSFEVINTKPCHALACPADIAITITPLA